MESTEFSDNCLERPASALARRVLVAPIVEKLARRLQRNYDLSDADREDLTQDGILAGIDALETYDESKSSVATWISIRAQGEMLDSLRKRRNAGITGNGPVELVDTEIASLDSVSSNSDPEDDSEDGDLLQNVPTEHPDHDPVLGAEIAQMLDYVAQLPEEDQMMLRLKFGLGGGPAYTLQLIADRLQISEVAVFKRLKRAMEALSKKMRVNGG